MVFVQIDDAGALVALARAEGEDGTMGDAVWDVVPGEPLFEIEHDELQAAAPCVLLVERDGRATILPPDA